MSDLAAAPRVAVVGGGLAGLAAAVALAESCRVEVCEARRMLGGRATSFQDPSTGEWIDHCQHVSMACCTNLADFCRRTSIDRHFRRERKLHFIGPDGRQFDLSATRWLPAPLHLAHSLARLGYLTLREKWRIARALLKLARGACTDDPDGPTIGQWLHQQGQSTAAIERFWSVVLVSALGESLDRASVAAARKVFVDGFLASRTAYEVEVPQVPLAALYGESLRAWFDTHQVRLHLSSPVKQVARNEHRKFVLTLPQGDVAEFDFVIVALTWRHIADTLSPELCAKLPWLAKLPEIEAAPITGVHLWFDRPITDLPHAVLIGRLSQWMFNRGRQPTGSEQPAGHYYQVVISASRELAGRERGEVIEAVRTELAEIWHATRNAQLLHARLVTEPHAVFSVRPGLAAIRPAQKTEVPGLVIAGDWTSTGWPSTMESAVRSGYLAAEAVLAALGEPRCILVPDLTRGLLARALLH